MGRPLVYPIEKTLQRCSTTTWLRGPCVWSSKGVLLQTYHSR